MQDTSNEIAFIGIGKMGLPMSLLIAKTGYSVTAYDQSAARLADARAQGVSVASSPAEAVNGQSVVITSLPDDVALRAALLGSNGLLVAMAPNSVLIETSTVSAEASAEVGAAASQGGIAYLRAPISGNASIAHTGALTCFVSGPADAFNRVKPLFAAFTRAQTYLGPAEEARYAKLRDFCFGYANPSLRSRLRLPLYVRWPTFSTASLKTPRWIKYRTWEALRLTSAPIAAHPQIASATSIEVPASGLRPVISARVAMCSR